MSAISATVGGSKETLWRYFPSKEALFAAYIEHATATFRGRLALNLDAKVPVEKALEDFIKHYIEEICSPESIGLHRLAVSESARFPEIGRLFYERAPQATEGLLTEFLARQMTNGNLRSADANRAAQTLLQLCMTERYPVLFGVQVAADVDATRLARTILSEFYMIYK